VVWSEWIRVISYPSLLAIMTYNLALSPTFYAVAAVYALVSISWFYSINRQTSHVQVI
jgi:hypothetical protein